MRRASARRRQLLLSTATLIGAMTGYGRGAYALCSNTGGSNFECLGAVTTGQIINANNATVTTAPGFSIVANLSFNALTITGNGALSYIDANASPLTAFDFGLVISSGGDDGATPGSITVNTGGVMSARRYGIHARNTGSGAVSITANGDITATTNQGISARNSSYGTDLTVTTGAGTTVTARNFALDLRNEGSGMTTVNINGDVTSTNSDAVLATNSGSGLTLTTASGTTVYGDRDGIRAETSNAATGATTVTINGDVEGAGGAAVEVYANGGTNLSVTTAAGTTVTGISGIDVRGRLSTGAVTIRAYGDVTSTGDRAIRARNDIGTDITIITGAGATTMGRREGIYARNQGSGLVEVTANGDVTSTLSSSDGIYARNENGTNLNLTTAAGTTVTGGDSGIFAQNQGSGASRVTANGDVTGNNGSGISVSGAGSSTDVTTAADTLVKGDEYGIVASTSAGSLTVTANGDVTGTTLDGIFTENTAGYSVDSDIEIVTGAGTTVTGGYRGVGARSYAGGMVSITVNGDVTGAVGIYAYHFGGGQIDITVGASSTVTSNGDFAVRTYSGPTNLIVAGTLNGGAAGAVAFDQNNALDDRMELRTTAVVNGNVLAGPGADTLAFAGTGNGTFDLANIDTGANTQQYQGFETFVVESATWTMNNTTTADFIVEGGTLKGNGTFGSLTVNGGTLAPGNSFGTMTVNGAFTLNAGATFEVEVNANNMGDVVVVNGTVNLTGATLRILAAPGDYKLETDYVIIDNDGTDAVNGTFGTITSTLAFLIPTVFYAGGTGNDVVLRLTRNEVDPCDVADTQNQSETCGAIDPDNPLFPLILGQTAAGARQAFDALSGEIHATAAGVLVDDNRYVREAILGRLMQAGHTNSNGQTAALGAGGPDVASLGSPLAGGDKSLAPPPRAPLAFWTAAYGAWGDYDGNGNAATADRDLGGFMSGMDASIGGSWRVGLTTGASFSDVSVDARSSSADAETYYLGSYTGGMVGSFALRGGGTWAWSDIDTSRAVIFPGFFESQKASYDADIGQIFGEVAYPTNMGGMSVEPFAGLAYVSLDADTFVERGGPLASLRGRDTDQNVGYTTLGVRVATTTQWGSTLVTPHLSARWQHAFNDVTPTAALAFATTGAGFTVAGVPLAEDSALIDAGLDFALGENATAGVSYSGQYGDGVQDNAVKGRFTWLF